MSYLNFDTKLKQEFKSGNKLLYHTNCELKYEFEAISSFFY